MIWTSGWVSSEVRSRFLDQYEEVAQTSVQTSDLPPWPSNVEVPAVEPLPLGGGGVTPEPRGELHAREVALHVPLVRRFLADAARRAAAVADEVVVDAVERLRKRYKFGKWIYLAESPTEYGGRTLHQLSNCSFKINMTRYLREKSSEIKLFLESNANNNSRFSQTKGKTKHSLRFE